MPLGISKIADRAERWKEYLVNDNKGIEIFNAVKADIRRWKNDPQYVANQVAAFYHYFHSDNMNDEDANYSIYVLKQLAIRKATTIAQYFSFIEILKLVFNLKLTSGVIVSNIPQ